MATVLTAAQINNLVKLHASGLSPNAIGVKAGVSGPTVRKHLRERGVKLKTRPTYKLPAKEVVRFYQSGKGLGELASRYGTSNEPIRTILHKHGIKIIDAGARLRIKFGYSPTDDLPAKEVVRRYKNGESVVELANRYRTTRGAIQRTLKKQGIKLRTASEQETIKWSKMTKAQRVKQVASAQKARRGQKDSSKVCVARAKTRHQRMLNVGSYENKIAAALRRKRLRVEQQFPVGHYNLDIALQKFSIAVEIVGVYGLTSGKTASFHKRTKYLFNRGWTIVFVIGVKRSTPDIGALAKKLHALTKLPCRNNSSCRWYGVLRSNAEPALIRRSTRYDIDYATRIKGF